jgi:serine/threonine protein kinase
MVRPPTPPPSPADFWGRLSPPAPQKGAGFLRSSRPAQQIIFACKQVPHRDLKSCLILFSQRAARITRVSASGQFRSTQKTKNMKATAPTTTTTASASAFWAAPASTERLRHSSWSVVRHAVTGSRQWAAHPLNHEPALFRSVRLARTPGRALRAMRRFLKANPIAFN